MKSKTEKKRKGKDAKNRPSNTHHSSNGNHSEPSSSDSEGSGSDTIVSNHQSTHTPPKNGYSPPARRNREKEVVASDDEDQPSLSPSPSLAQVVPLIKRGRGRPSKAQKAAELELQRANTTKKCEAGERKTRTKSKFSSLKSV